MNSDCSDIRFTYPNPDGTEIEIPYWIESDCNTPNTKIWVKVPNIPASSTTTIYVYYGNPSARSLSNVTQVALNGFGASYNTPGSWNLLTYVSGTWSVTSLGTYSQTSTDSIARDTQGAIYFPNSIINTPYVIEAELIPYQAGQRTGIIAFAWASSIDVFGYRFINQNANYENGFSFLNDHVVWVVSGTATNTAGVKYHYRVINNTGVWTAGFWQVGSTPTYQISNYTYTANPYYTPANVGVGISYVYTTGIISANSPIEVYYIFVRKYTSPEPTTSIGAEETISTLSVVFNYNSVDFGTVTPNTIAEAKSINYNVSVTSSSDYKVSVSATDWSGPTTIPANTLYFAVNDTLDKLSFATAKQLSNAVQLVATFPSTVTTNYHAFYFNVPVVPVGTYTATVTITYEVV
jgi:hypothetical protein